MQWLSDLITNPFLVTGFSSWAIAQVLKAVIHLIVHKQFDIHRLFGDGGMPSGHSATVTSLAVLCGMVFGTGSFQFAISAVLAVIVCHDAMGVRLETGKQAIVINELVKAFNILASKDLPASKLKEFVGHSPVQVAAGIALGIMNALIMHRVLF